MRSVEEAQARLSFLAENKKLWSQQMHLDVGAEAIHLRDVNSQVMPDSPVGLWDMKIRFKHVQVSTIFTCIIT